MVMAVLIASDSISLIIWNDSISLMRYIAHVPSIDRKDHKIIEHPNMPRDVKKEIIKIFPHLL